MLEGEVRLKAEKTPIDKMGASTGIKSLDELLGGIRSGDNIVWLCGSNREYRLFIKPFVSHALDHNFKTIYVKIDGSLADLMNDERIEVFDASKAGDPKGFTDQISGFIREKGLYTHYVFDNITALGERWTDGEELAVFFQEICPILYDLKTLTYFSLRKGAHSNSILAMIRDTAQILIDVEKREIGVIIHLVKVWDRYSADMFKAHIFKDGALELVEEIDFREYAKQLEDKTGELHEIRLKLKESEENYKTLINTANDVIFVLDLEGNFQLINSKAEKISGYSKGQVIGKNFVKMGLVAPEYLESTIQRFHERIKGAPSSTYEIEIIRRDGGRVPVELSTTAIKRDDKIVGVLGIARDITERRKVEEELKGSEEKYRGLVESSTDAIISIDESMAITLWNPTAENIFGYSKDEAIGKSLDIIIPEKYRESHKKGMERFLKSEISKVIGKTVELEAKRKDGKLIPVELSISAVRQEGGYTFTGILRDITERKRAEEEIHLLQTITQAVSDSQDYHSALEITLRKVCETTGWSYGEAWTPRSDGTVLEYGPVWYDNTKDLEKFRHLSEKYTFPPDTGLPGRIWSSKQPEWLQDVSREPETIFLRASVAIKAGLKAGFGVPIIINGQVLAVLVFFMYKSSKEDKRLVELVSAVATQLGSVIQRKRAEEELKKHREHLEDLVKERTVELGKSEARYHSLVESVPYGIQENDTSGVITFSNLAHARMHGYEEGELVGKAIWDMLASDSKRKELREYLAMLVRDQPPPTPYITKDRTKDGRVIDVQIDWNYKEDESGNLAGFVSVITDITERRRAEEALRNIAEGVSAEMGESFFTSLVNHLSNVLQVDYVFVGELGENNQSVTTVALSVKGEIAPNFEYNLEGTPCHNVVGKEICVYPKNVAQLFPNDKSLVEMGIKSYMGSPLFGAKGQPLGLLVIMDSKLLEGLELKKSLLKIFAVRAANELERKRAEEDLQRRVKELEEFHSITVGRELKMIELEKEIERLKES